MVGDGGMVPELQRSGYVWVGWGIGGGLFLYLLFNKLKNMISKIKINEKGKIVI